MHYFSNKFYRIAKQRVSLNLRYWWSDVA